MRRTPSCRPRRRTRASRPGSTWPSSRPTWRRWRTEDGIGRGRPAPPTGHGDRCRMMPTEPAIDVSTPAPRTFLQVAWAVLWRYVDTVCDHVFLFLIALLL